MAAVGATAQDKEGEEEEYFESLADVMRKGLDEFDMSGIDTCEVLSIMDKTMNDVWDIANYYNPIYKIATAYHPMCAVLRYAVSEHVTCPFIRLLNSYFTKSTPGIDPILKRHRVPNHPKYPCLPLPLNRPNDGPLYLPEMIPQEIFLEEKATYYWYFSLIMNLWKHVLEVYHAHVEKRPPAALPQIGPPGWRNVDCLQGFDELSLAVLITNNQGHLVVIYRGSVIGEDWVTNFDYNLISPQETQSGVDCMKGRVHEGYFKLLQTQLHTLRRVVETLNPTRVTVTGHSLGGAMAHLASYYIATTFPQLNVEAVVVGAPQVADQEFFEDYRMKVNSRSIAFLGRGYESRFKSATGKRRFEVGDVVVQVPFACYYTPDCKSPNTRHVYHMSPGLVPIYATNLTNAAAWVNESNWLLDRNVGGEGMASTHMCSYMCWFSEGSVDHGSLCYLPERGPQAPKGVDVCDIDQQKSEARKKRENRRSAIGWDGNTDSGPSPDSTINNNSKRK